MISQLYNKYVGKTIAIVGSGITSEAYNGNEDVSIALNGAIQLDKPIDYAMGFDRRLPTREWFSIKPEITRIYGAGIAKESPLCYGHLKSVDMKSSILEDEELENNPPNNPHLL